MDDHILAGILGFIGLVFFLLGLFHVPFLAGAAVVWLLLGVTVGVRRRFEKRQEFLKDGVIDDPPEHLR